MNTLNVFSRFDLTGELMMYVFSIIMLILIIMTRPVSTPTSKIAIRGLLASVLTITAHIHLLWMICEPETFSHTKYVFFYFIYSLFYLFMVNMIMKYIELLSYKNRQNIRKVNIKLILSTTVYLIIICYPIVTNQSYVILSDGSIMLTKWQHVIPICGILDAVFCLVSSIRNVKRVSRVVSVGCLTFIPLSIIALVLQIQYSSAYFISFTYVVPFVIFYCLFHAIKFNDITGCQSIEALQSYIARSLLYKRKFVLVRVEFPQLKSRMFSDLSAVVEDASSIVCRNIEHLNVTSRIYMTSDYTFTMLAYVKNKDAAVDLSYKITEILNTPVEVRGSMIKPIFKQTVICSDSRLKDASNYISMFGYLKHMLKDDYSSECIVASDDDYKNFETYDEAEKLVLDVRSANNLDDDRVVCYIQPIYNIATGSFRSGEALMRMQSEGKMLFPDTFIPAAERNNCIHTLTLIMINRICAKIKELELENYDFDGITVNCSTLELSELDFSDEIKDIVIKHGIKPSHLRLELTESVSALNMANVRINMQALTEYGISFYLDDYGTGYSNLERMTTYPFKTIKFDKSLLYSALRTGTANDLVRMELSFFKSNGYSTVVEGVEDENMYNYCKEVGFDMIQGYYFSKPQPANDIIKYFSK